MKRREFLTLLAGAAALWPLAAGAQQGDRVRALQNRILHMQAELVAANVRQFIKEIESQLGWTVQIRWSAGTIEQRRVDSVRLLHQVPAITELAQLDAAGIEQLRVSRLAMDVAAGKRDFSQEAKFTEAMAKKVYYGPVELRELGRANPPRPEPYMTLSLAGARRDAGVSVAEVNLKPLWDLVSSSKIGERGATWILDARAPGAQARLIAHSDISLVLGKTDMTSLVHVQAARSAGAATEPVRIARDIHGREVLTAHAAIAPLGWLVFVELPIDELDALAQ